MRTMRVLGGLVLGVVPVSEPSVTYSADCVGLTVVTSGHRVDVRGMLSIGDEPPRSLTLNASVFTPWPYDLDGVHTFTIMVVDPVTPSVLGGYHAGSVDCVVVEELAPVVVEPEPVVAAETVGIDYSIWSHVELAPPW